MAKYSSPVIFPSLRNSLATSSFIFFSGKLERSVVSTRSEEPSTHIRRGSECETKVSPFLVKLSLDTPLLIYFRIFALFSWASGLEWASWMWIISLFSIPCCFLFDACVWTSFTVPYWEGTVNRF